MLKTRKHIILALFFLWTILYSFAQTEQLAQTYFDNGDFEKAENLYQSLLDKQSYNFTYAEKLIKCQQSLGKFDAARLTIEKQLSKYPNQMFLYVELGYNLERQNQEEQAKVYYEKALNHLKSKPSEGYQIAKSFLDHSKLNEALESYQVMMLAFPTNNFYGQIALIYGEMGNVEKMFDTYLDMLTMSDQVNNIPNIKNFMSRYLTDDDQSSNNVLLRKILVKRIQNNPLDEWYKTLSWLYIQQKDYSKALVQEKSVYLRNKIDLSGLIDVGRLAYEDADYKASKEANTFILSQKPILSDAITAHFFLLESNKKLLSKLSANYLQELNEIEMSYQSFFKEYENMGNMISPIYSSYAHFLTFYKNEPEKAIETLKKSISTNIDRFKIAELKIQLADIMVFNGLYNQALILYSQVQNELKNHPLAQMARFKVAQTSYFKGDFEWANTQLKVLKIGTTKLIANDAIDLSMLIGDNIAQDSIQTALKIYAKADLLAFQNKTQQSIDTLNILLANQKGHPIEDEALFKQAELFTLIGKYDEAINNYEKILQLNPDDILVDDALYQMALIYDEKLMDNEKAIKYYEKIVLEHTSSIYLVASRKRYRELRGDTLLP